MKYLINNLFLFEKMESSSSSDDNGVLLEKIRKKLESYEDKGYDKEYESDWKQMLNELNTIKTNVYKEQMFSDNEEFKDVKTEDIKFMLVAYYQSELIQKFHINRKNVLQFALTFYNEFFKLLKNYEYVSKDQIKYYESMTKKNDDDDDNNKKNKMKDFAQLSLERQTKIEMYKYKKALSEKIKRIEKEQNYDDNREYWCDYLNLALAKMYDSIKMINMEIDSLNYLEKMKKEKEGNNNNNNSYTAQQQQNKPKQKMEILQIKSVSTFTYIYIMLNPFNIA